MESVGIDCQKTMHNAGFDFQMPNRGSVNRCGCILANDPSISAISLNGRKSHQEFIQPNENQVNAMCDRLAHEYSDLFLSARVIRISDIVLRSPICHECRDIKQNISCPPYSGLIDLSFWQFAVVWHWRPNRFKKTRYNVALKTLHAALFSLGFYFALSIRDCYCDECTFCSASAVEQPSCPSRKIMAPSMQSQGIDHHQFGEGRFGVELL
jgi:predicted metal-binding protein